MGLRRIHLRVDRRRLRALPRRRKRMADAADLAGAAGGELLHARPEPAREGVTNSLWERGSHQCASGSSKETTMPGNDPIDVAIGTVARGRALGRGIRNS